MNTMTTQTQQIPKADLQQLLEQVMAVRGLNPVMIQLAITMCDALLAVQMAQQNDELTGRTSDKPHIA